MNTEKQTRKKLIELAKSLGFEVELKRIFDRYDPLLKNARYNRNEKEFKQISIMANVEVHKLFDFRNPLVCDGVEIMPATQDEDMLIRTGKV